ncbi:hypothetical protein ACFL6I_02070 [candidate division KSB1 bacterium]
MICPSCSAEIPDDTLACPECGELITESANDPAKREGERKEFTHYRIILLNPGPREDIVEILMEITGLSSKKVEQRLKDLPWTVASRIPFSEAQEIKILLETGKAIARIEGIDIWEEEHVEEVASGEGTPGKKNRLKQKIIVFAVFSLIVGGIIYVIANMDRLRSGGIVQFREQESSDFQLGRTGGREGRTPGTGIGSIPRQERQDPFLFREEGPNPFTRELSVRFKLNEKASVTITLYNKSMQQVTILLNGTLEPDSYRVRWNGASPDGTIVENGLYFARLTSGRSVSVIKLVWLAQ